MASSYYGSKGNSVIEMQKRLNQLGAGIQVDGIWGQATENAYQKYVTQINQAGSKVQTAPNGAAYYQYDAKDDETLRKQAESTVGAEYDAQIKIEQAKAQKVKDALNQAIVQLDPQYRAKLDALEKEFLSDRQKFSEQALSRGMVRSSYYDSSIARSQQEEQKASNQVTQEYQMELADLNQQIAQTEQDLINTQGLLSAKRNTAVQKYLDSLIQKRDKTLFDMIKYNNSLLMKSQTASKSSSGRRSSSSSKSAADSREYQSSMQAWDELSNAGKITFFNNYGKKIYQVSRKAYLEMKDEIEALRRQGMIYGSVNKDYNYYKGGPKYTYDTRGR